MLRPLSVCSRCTPLLRCFSSFSRNIVAHFFPIRPSCASSPHLLHGRTARRRCNFLPSRSQTHFSMSTTPLLWYSFGSSKVEGCTPSAGQASQQNGGQAADVNNSVSYPLRILFPSRFNRGERFFPKGSSPFHLFISIGKYLSPQSLRLEMT